MSTGQAYFTLVFDGAYAPNWKEHLDRTLPMTPFSWNPEMLIWGDKESTSLEIWLDKGLPDHGQLRIDLRTPDLAFLANVTAFAKACNVSIEDEQGAWVPPTFDGIRLGLQRSAAWKLVRDPSEFLTQLGTTFA